MPAIKYKVNLSDDEKLQLENLLSKGKSAARSQTRARILLKAAAGRQDKDIIQSLDEILRGSDPNTATMRKLIHLSFAILKSGEPFDPLFAVK